MGNANKLEILEYNYWEHFKCAKDLALILPLRHPKRLKIEQELNKMIKELNEVKQNTNSSYSKNSNN